MRKILITQYKTMDIITNIKGPHNPFIKVAIKYSYNSRIDVYNLMTIQLRMRGMNELLKVTNEYIIQYET